MPRQKTPKFWQTQRFKELQKYWDDRLKSTGFKDAESNGKLCQNAFNCYRTQIREVIDNKQRYYELLGQKYHEENFNCDVDRYVMEMFSSGVPPKQISKELKKAGKKNGRDTIRLIISYYTQKWQLKKKRTL